MKELKVYYQKIDNMGDLLNELIIERVFNYKIVPETGRFKIDVTGIGSGLNGLFPNDLENDSSVKKAVVNIVDKVSKPMVVWSTGFISYPSGTEVPLRNKIEFASVRGELTRQRLEKITNRDLSNVVTGDGGLLSSEIIDHPIQKKYKIGIIPHYKEINESVFSDLANSYSDSILINLLDDPMKVVEQIASCEYILSSSLHGLIVADSFNIPNKRLTYTNNLLGDGYKFNDYYSAFGLKSHKPIDLNVDKFPTILDIDNDYEVTKKMVETKKVELKNSFQKYFQG